MNNNTAENIYLEAAKLFKAEKIDDAATLAEQATSIDPKHSDTLHLMALIQLQRRQLDDAATRVTRVLELEPRYGEAHNTLGLIELERKNYQNAIKAFEKCERLLKDGRALDNLASCYLALGDMAQAEKFYKKALSSHRDAKTLSRYATYLLHTGEIEQGLEHLREATALAPSDANLYNTYLDNIFMHHPMEDWEPHLAMPEHLKYSGFELARAVIPVALYAWVFGKDSALFNTLNFSYKAFFHKAEAELLQWRAHYGSDHQKFKLLRALIAFFNYIARLAQSHLVPLESSDNTIYSIGDSHIIAPARLNVTYAGQEHHFSPRLIMGIKAFHLSPGAIANQYKSAFIHQWHNTPEDATCFVSVGEIDCRTDGGIWHHAQKYGKPVDNIIQKTVEGFFATLKEIQGNRRVIVSGIPAPAKDLGFMDDGGEAYLDMICRINQLYKKECEKCGFDFADIHALTVDPKTKQGNKKWHLEEIHLVPQALSEAFKAL